jgi:hypothetical protein
MLTYSSIVGSLSAATVALAAILAGAPMLSAACFALAAFIGSAVLALVSFRTLA